MVRSVWLLVLRLPSHAAVAGGWIPLLTLAKDTVKKEGLSGFAFKLMRIAGISAARVQDEATPSAIDVQTFDERTALELLHTLEFPVPESPKVSIVVPAFDNFALTVGCLAALRRNEQTSTFEVLLVDDASIDQTPKNLASIPGVRYLRNDTNQGYLRSCNRAFEEARGEYVCLLNNDTQVQAGWLDPLVESLDRMSGVGAVGSKLLFPDGRLQEAGARLSRQAGALVGELIGLGASSADPLYQYARAVEYSSGACLLIRRAILEKTGGLDTSFAPAYFEDVDLAYQVRNLGFSVVYEPRSEVMHHLSATTDENGDAHSKQELVKRNGQIFAQKWHDEIARNQRVRAIAFYLPQYHPIPENDVWWGKGFTEWTNVAKARPNFDGHYQPHLPGELGFYDLRLAEAREQQAELARQHGIYGFCYYAYWFAGRRLLNRPFDDVLSSRQPDFPFCVCWANENWTRTWDGNDHHVLIGQQHSAADDLAFMRSLVPALRDERYIRVDGKPLVLVYKVNLLPQPSRTATLWRDLCLKSGVGDIYLACVHNNANPALNIDPRMIGFDAAVEFPPLGKGVIAKTPRRLLNKEFRGICYDYVETVKKFQSQSCHPYTYFRGVMPSWDNTARRQDSGHIFLGSGPDVYRAWLDSAVEWTAQMQVGDERLVFINAWNEWAEGNHLEPDAKYGRAYLEATSDVMGRYG